MCGIVGILGAAPVAGADRRGAEAARISRLRFRRHRDAGERRAERRRAPGQAAQPRSCVSPTRRCAGTIGIGHTRWATHGKPNETNAHPHATRAARRRPQRHHRELPRAARGTDRQGPRLRDRDRHRGRRPSRHRRTCDSGKAPAEAVAAALPRLRGAFALAFLFDGEDDLLIGARHGAPLAVGYGDGEMYLGSDALALAPFTDAITYLEEGDWVVLTRERRRDSATSRQAGEVAAPKQRSLPARLPDRQGQLPPLHGQGDPRAARGRRPHARPLRRPVGGRVALPFELPSISPSSTASRSSPAARPIWRA